MILVACDMSNERSRIINHELLGKARELGKQNGELVAACLPRSEEGFDDLFEHGAQKVIYNDSLRLEQYWMASELIGEIIKQQSPSLVMLPATAAYKPVAACAATLCGGGLTADCVDVYISDKWGYVFTRAAMGASVMAEIVCINTQVQICTVKPGTFHKHITAFPVGEKNVSQFSISKPDLLSQMLEPLRSHIHMLNSGDDAIEKSKMVISLGRGVKAEDYEEIRRIARKIQAGVGGTRVLVEKGMLTKSVQIGQSGITVTPNLYLALGISGASQHIVGMQDSKQVIAVNLDRNAPIFEYSDYAIVGDTHTVIEQLAKVV